MKPNLNLQLCIYPHLDAGWYANASRLMLMVRVGFGIADFGIWYDNPARALAKASVPMARYEP
jgi:hypothetical protein